MSKTPEQFAHDFFDREQITITGNPELAQSSLKNDFMHAMAQAVEEFREKAAVWFESKNDSNPHVNLNNKQTAAAIRALPNPYQSN
jgi:hypothetical protein